MLTEVQLIIFIIVHLSVGGITSVWVWKNIQEPAIVKVAVEYKNHRPTLRRLSEIHRLQKFMIALFALWGIPWGLFVLLFRKRINPLQIDFDD
jgi:hypothetical protein